MIHLPYLSTLSGHKSFNENNFDQNNICLDLYRAVALTTLPHNF